MIPIDPLGPDISLNSETASSNMTSSREAILSQQHQSNSPLCVDAQGGVSQSVQLLNAGSALVGRYDGEAGMFVIV